MGQDPDEDTTAPHNKTGQRKHSEGVLSVDIHAIEEKRHFMWETGE